MSVKNGYMKLFKKIVKNHGFFICVFLTILSAILLRTYNFGNRIGIGSDSGRDIMIGQIALQRHELPLIGSFSSAGPFVFGPLYYWLVMAGLTILPFSFRGPWLLMSMIGVFTVIVMMLTGYRLGGKKLCIVLGLITSFCPQFVSRSTGLGQHSLVGITCALLLLFFVLFYQTKKKRYAFLMGISLGAALSMHYQAINLLIFLATPFFVPKISYKRKFLSFACMVIGLIIPSLPIIYWDAHQNFANTNNILDYVFIGQYRIYVPNSWKIYLFRFLPDYWSNVVGGNKPVAGVLMIFTFLTFFYAFLKRKMQGEIAILGIIFGILLIVIRYYRGERFEGYMIYIAPLIFLLTGWALTTVYDYIHKRFNGNIVRILSIIVFGIILAFDFKNASQFIFVKDYEKIKVLTLKNALTKTYPHSSFQLYDYNWISSETSYPLADFLNNENKLSKSGIAIGIKVIDSCTLSQPLYSDGNLELVTLGENNKQVDLKKEGWVPVNPDNVYDDLITRWTKKQKLTSTFSLSKFIKSKLSH